MLLTDNQESHSFQYGRDDRTKSVLEIVDNKLRIKLPIINFVHPYIYFEKSKICYIIVKLHNILTS